MMKGNDIAGIAVPLVKELCWERAHILQQAAIDGATEESVSKPLPQSGFVSHFAAVIKGINMGEGQAIHLKTFAKSNAQPPIIV